MSRMLEALRQIESRTSLAPRPSETAWPAGSQATSWAEPVEAAPLEGFTPSPPTALRAPTEGWSGEKGGIADQQLWQQVEAALAAEKTSDSAGLPVATATADPSLPLPPSGTIRRMVLRPAEADPYSRLADALLAELSTADAAALMFTSVEDDGKTAVVARLAAALAPRVAGGVLAVDGNFRAAELAAHLGAEPAGGLPEVLAGTASWRDVVRPTVLRGLSVLAGGPSAGFEPAALGRLLAEFRQQYHLVLIETASLRHPEAAPLAAWCDGAYLVVRLGRTARRAIGEAAAAIQQCQGRLRGCIAVV
jgi:Mrp family chromosome partitioning ATPase